MKEYQNLTIFVHNKWLLYHLSIEGVPFPEDLGYEAYTTELDEKFNRFNVGGILRLEFGYYLHLAGTMFKFDLFSGRKP